MADISPFSYRMIPDRITPVDCLTTDPGGIVTGVDAVLAAHMLQQDFHFVRIADGDSTIGEYIYVSGVYCTGAKKRLEAELYCAFDGYVRKNRQPVMNQSKVKEVLNRAFSDRTQSQDVLDHKSPILNVSNGLLDLETGDLLPHDPKIITLSQLETVYDPTAECPRFMKYLDEVLDGKYHPAMQEIMGYTLWPEYPAHKCFLLYGPPRTGKSTMLRVIEGLLGEQAFSVVSLQGLATDNHTVWELYGKMANIHGDLPKTVIIEPGILKTLTGGDTVRGEQKYKDGFGFKNRAKLIFGSNHVPAIKADDEAFYGRWVMLPFNRNVEDIMDSQLDEKLTTTEELSGVLNWALEGLMRLRANGFRFSPSENGSDLYRRLSKPIVAFLEECTEEDDDAQVSKDDLYSAYRRWSGENGIKSGSKIAFGKELRNIGFEDAKVFDGSDQHRGWGGIRLKRSD